MSAKDFLIERATLPPQLTMETLAKWLVTIYTDRYITGQKVMDSTSQLGVGRSLFMKMKRLCLTR